MMKKNKQINNSTRILLYATIGILVASISIVALREKLQLANFLNAERASAQNTQTTQSYTAAQAFNEDGNQKVDQTKIAWFGTGQNIGNSYLGLRFENVHIPAGSSLNDVTLTLKPTQDQWIYQKTTIYAEKSANTETYSSTNPPSKRTPTTASSIVEDNVKWNANNDYTLPSILSTTKEVLEPGTSKTLNIILKGSAAGSWARKFVQFANGSTPKLNITYTASTTNIKTPPPISPAPSTSTPSPVRTPATSTKPGATATSMPMPSGSTPMTHTPGESMALHAWRVGAKNAPNPKYDKCDDGTDIVAVHELYYVVAYDGVKYPTWHPPVVNNPITGVGKCYFGHEHGSNPQQYIHWDEIVAHFGKDLNNDGVITKMTISDTGAITPGDRAGIPFGMANEHMDEYYNQEGRDSLFVRHEDHVGHKIEYVNSEAEMVGNTTNTMPQLPGTNGINIPFYKSGTNTYQATGVSCSHLHKFHQGTASGDAMRNNLHEVIFHSSCTSVNTNNINAPAYYPNNTVILTGMMTFGNPGTYQRFCLDNPVRNSKEARVCVDGQNSDGTCKISDPLISKLPNAAFSDTLGRNMIDRYCLQNFDSLNPGVNYFNPYEIWQGDLQIKTATGNVLAEHGRQWDVLDPIRFVDPNSSTGFAYNADQCYKGGLLWSPKANNFRTLSCGTDGSVKAWDSPQSGFRGLHRTTYFGRNHITNAGGPQVYWTDPLGGNATPIAFTSGLKQKLSSVNADINKVQFRVQQLYGSNNFLNDRALQRHFNDGSGTVHAPN